DQHTLPWPGLIHSWAVPDASGSPVMGTSFAPTRWVVNGRPPTAPAPVAASVASAAAQATALRVRIRRIGCLHDVLPRRERSRGRPGAPWAERARPRYADLDWRGLHANLSCLDGVCAPRHPVRLRPMHGRRDAGGT